MVNLLISNCVLGVCDKPKKREWGRVIIKKKNKIKEDMVIKKWDAECIDL